MLSFTLSPFIRVNKCVLNIKRVAGPGLDTGDLKVVQMQSCPQGAPRAKVNCTLTHASQALHGFYPIHASQDSASRVGGGVGVGGWKLQEALALHSHPGPCIKRSRERSSALMHQRVVSFVRQWKCMGWEWGKMEREMDRGRDGH